MPSRKGRTTRAGRRAVRHASVRRKIYGTTRRPRLAVFRSGRHTYAQIIDDSEGTTLVSASTLESDFSRNGTKLEQAATVGELVAKRAVENSINSVVFDRGGHRYHGRVAAVGDAARDQGLEL